MKQTPTTVTEIATIKLAKYEAKMNYLMAKSLLEGKADPDVLKWAEMIYKTQKTIFEESL